MGHSSDRRPRSSADARPGLRAARPVPDWAGSPGCSPRRSEPPFPRRLAVHAGPACIAANHPPAAQPGEEFRHARVQAAFDPLDQGGPAPCTDAQATPVRHARRPPLVAARLRVAQVRRQTLDGGPNRGARRHAGRDRGPRPLPAAGTPTALRLPARADRLHRRHLNRVIDGWPRWPGFRHPVTARGADLRLGRDPLVRVRMQGPSTPGTSDTGLAPCPLRCACWSMRLARVRGRPAGMLRVCDRLVQLGFHVG